MKLAEINNHRVLVIDDNESIHEDFRKILGGVEKPSQLASMEDLLFGGGGAREAGGEAPFEIDCATQGEQGYKMAVKARQEGRPYGVAFIDMRMPPGWDGLRTIREIWNGDPDLNIVICTAYADNSWNDIEELGGDSDRMLVLKKPFEPIEVRRMATTLTAKWTLARRAAMKMTELESLVEKRTAELHRSATHDMLTGLPNRVLFNDRLTQALLLSRRSPNYRFAVLFLDFDRFKVVNDSLGHNCGDLLLKGIGERLTSILRTSDTVAFGDADGSTAARLGGDEFCVLLSGLSSDDMAAMVAGRILEALAEPYAIAGQTVHSTASIGIALSSPGYERAEDIVRDADTAMYRAKAEGKGRFVVFDRSMHEQAMRRLTIETGLRSALEENQLRVFYQPIICLETGKMTGIEALARWQHPERGLIMPGEFVGIAEESGLIGQVGAWVLAEACRQVKEWSVRWPEWPISVSVNVSSKQLASTDLCAQVEAALAETGLGAGSLILEMTESALADATSARTREALQALKKQGVRIYLDDFGTGYSSLSLLHGFNLDGLKIDRSFVKEALGNARYAMTVQAITELAHKLGMAVIAEGVETPAHMQLLRSLRCEEGQGYLFSRPVCGEELEKMLRTNFGGKGAERAA